MNANNVRLIQNTQIFMPLPRRRTRCPEKHLACSPRQRNSSCVRGSV